MGHLLKNTIIYSLGRILPQAVNFILLPIYSEYLSPSQYGIIESMIVFSTILTIIFSFATERSMFRIYYDYKKKDDKKKFIGNTTILIAISATFFLGLIFLLHKPISKIYSEVPFNPYFIYAILTAYATTFAYIPQTLFQVKEKAFAFFIISIIAFLLEILLTIYFVIIIKEEALGLLKAKLIANVLMLPLYLYIIKQESSFQLDRAIIKNIFLFSLPMMPILLTSWVMNMSNRVFIENYFTLREVGIFSMASKLSSVATILLGALFTAYNPMFYRLADDENQFIAKNKIQELNKLLIGAIFMVSFVVVLFSKEVVFILNSRYQEAVLYIPILVLANAINYLAGIYSLMIYQNKKSGIIMYIYIIGAIFSVIFNYVLVPQFGALGASWVNVIASLVILLLSIYYAKKNYYIPLQYTYILLGIAISVIILYINNYVNISILFFITKIILVILAVCFVLYKKRKLININE